MRPFLSGWAAGARQLRRRAGALLAAALLAAGCCWRAARLAGRLLRGVGDARFTLAVSAQGGTAQALGLAARMEDLARYCTVVQAGGEEEALALLQSGQAGAALLLPEQFLSSVLTGENAAPQLVVADGRPVDSLLALWLGRSAVRMLCAAQSGVYTALDAIRAQPGLPAAQLTAGLDLAYLRYTLGRAQMYRAETVQATGALAPAAHYGLLWPLYLLALTLPAARPALYMGGGLLRRARAAGGRPLAWLAGRVWAVCLWYAALLWAGLALLGTAGPGQAALRALPVGALLACWGFLCANLGRRAGGVLRFAWATAGLVLCGGLLPPALLPSALRWAARATPLYWAAQWLGPALGARGGPAALPVLLAGGALLFAAGCLAAWHRGEARE